MAETKKSPEPDEIMKLPLKIPGEGQTKNYVVEGEGCVLSKGRLEGCASLAGEESDLSD